MCVDIPILSPGRLVQSMCLEELNSDLCLIKPHLDRYAHAKRVLHCPAKHLIIHTDVRSRTDGDISRTAGKSWF